jgi:hypothetical protein
MTNAAALEKTIKALPALSDEHAALIEQARSLARAIDAGAAEAPIHAEYRHALRNLLEAGRPEEADAFEKLLADLRGTPDA